MNHQGTSVVIPVAVAALVITATLGAYYYGQYNQELATNRTYAAEINDLNSKYSSVASSYNSLLLQYDSAVSNYRVEASRFNGSLASMGQLISSFDEAASNFRHLAASYQSLLANYNDSLYLLVRAVSAMNTSEPAYKNATAALGRLSEAYDNLTLQFQSTVAQYDSLVSSFQAAVAKYQSANNVTLSSQYLPAPTTTTATITETQSPTASTITQTQTTTTIPPVLVSLLTANILVSFGNGTAHWYNSTRIQAGWTMYITTAVLFGGSLDATWYPQYGEHFINGIDGLKNTGSNGWFLWTHNGTGWQLAQAGADMTIATNGASYAWTYCPFNTSYQPTCTP